MCWWCNWTQNTGHSSPSTLPMNCSLSIYQLHHSMSGMSPSKRIRGVTQSLFCIGAQRGYWSISTPHCSQEGQVIQTLLGLLTSMIIPYFNPSSRISPCSISCSFLSTNTISKVSEPFSEIQIPLLLSYSSLTTKWCCLMWRLQQKGTCLGEVYT